MKKIKRKLPAMLLALLVMLFIPGIANAKTKDYQGERWNFKKTVQATSGAFTYYAYPSKNQKEAWIYKIKINKWKNYSRLSIPSKLGKKKVTRLGARCLAYYELYSVVGEEQLPHQIWKVTKKTGRRIQKLVIPNTVKVIQPYAFAGMCYIDSVKIPKQVKTLNEGVFYGCLSLKKVELPAGLKSMDARAFWQCPKLTDLKLPSNNKTYRVDGKCVITKKDQALVCALAGGKTFQIPEGVKTLKRHSLINCVAETVHIPASVNKIEGGAFWDPYDHPSMDIKNVTVDGNNSVYAKDGQCIYNKIDKSLSVAIYDEKNALYISGQVERLTEDISTVIPNYYEESVKDSPKVVYPKDFKTVVDEGMDLLLSSHIYFTAEKPPELVKEKKKDAKPPIFRHIYVPEASEEVYWQWYSGFDYDEEASLTGWDTFKPEDKI